MKSVLLADDESAVRVLVSVTLSGDPRYKVLLAADGEEALAVARKERPDLIFLDIMMPKVTGIDVCAQLKADPGTRALKIVMLTALSHDQARKQAATAGADGYFTKPFSPTALIRKVEEALGLV